MVILIVTADHTANEITCCDERLVLNDTLGYNECPHCCRTYTQYGELYDDMVLDRLARETDYPTRSELASLNPLTSRVEVV